MSLVRLRGSVCVPCQGVGQFWKSMLKVSGRVWKPLPGGLEAAASIHPDISPKNPLWVPGDFPSGFSRNERGSPIENFRL